jgi:hypothetical protein
MPLSADKPKNKQALHTHRWLHVLLLVWMILTFLAAFYPLIWLAPPYLHLTPYVYLGAALGWLPFTIDAIRQRGWRRLTIILVVGCIFSTACLGINAYTRIFPSAYTFKDYCVSDGTLITCGTQCGGDEYTYIFKPIKNTPIMVLQQQTFKDNSAFLCTLF